MTTRNRYKTFDVKPRSTDWQLKETCRTWNQVTERGSVNKYNCNIYVRRLNEKENRGFKYEIYVPKSFKSVVTKKAVAKKVVAKKTVAKKTVAKKTNNKRSR